VSPTLNHSGVAADINTMHVPVQQVYDDLGMLREWTMLLAATDIAPRTVELYTYALWRLLAFHRFQIHLVDMTEGAIVQFLAAQGARSTSKQVYYRGIRSFFAWAQRRGFLLDNPTDWAKPKRVPRSEAEALSIDELTRLLLAASYRSPQRGWAMLACFALGTRRGEFVNIRRGDVDHSAGLVHLEVTKGGKRRLVPMGPWAAEAIGELETLSTTDYICPVQPNTFTMWVQQAARDCGFTGKKARAHALRASFATYLSEQGVEIATISNLLGHSSIAVTSAYVATDAGKKAAAVGVLG
jgi:site-specific recombinase XerD